MALGQEETRPLDRRLRAGAFAVFCALSASVAAQTVVRETEFEYDATTGMLTLERVDPGGTHCVETKYQHDEFGNRKQVEVRPCASTLAEARFTPRITVNEFKASTEPGNAYPAGAYQTLTRTGTASSPRMTEALASYDARFGAAKIKTSVAVAMPTGDTSRNLSTRNEYDGFGRLFREYTPVRRNSDGSVVETYREHKYVYCQGAKATSDAACLNLSETVAVDYQSSRLVTWSGDVTNSAVVQIASAYFVESTPYDNAGQVIGARSRVHYDALHREIAKESETYDRGWTRTLVGYDQLGNQAATWGSHQGRASNGTTLAPPEDVRQWTEQRDVLHRPLIQAQYWRAEEGGTREKVQVFATYNGLETASRLPGFAPTGTDRISVIRKNGAGQVAQTENADGATVNMAYDAVGNLVKTVDALGNQTKISYTLNTARFKVGVDDPDVGVWTYAYDALGQLVRQTDARLVSVEMTYDDIGRLVKKSAPSFVSQWFYDTGEDRVTPCASGLNRLCATRGGRPEAGVPAVSSEEFAYDSLGRSITAKTTLDRAYLSSTTFDDMGRVSTVRYPTGFTVKHEYSRTVDGVTPGVTARVVDNANPSRVFWSIHSADVSPSQVFDARGNLLKAKLGNGVVIDNRFDPVSGKAWMLRSTGSAGAHALLEQYRYDKVNNLTWRQRSDGPTLTESFAYDILDRLIEYKTVSTMDPSSAANRVVTLKYNALGNILEKSDVGGYTYHATDRPHFVRAAGGTSYTPDANGNVLSGSGALSRTHVWDSLNLPQSLSLDGHRVEFAYDANLKRVREITTSGGTVKTLYLIHPDNVGGLGYEREETRVSGALSRDESRHYITVAGATVVVKTLGGSGVVDSRPEMTNYWHKNALGSVVSVTSSTGDVIERMAFDAWGRRLRDTGTLDPSVDPQHGNRGFTGHEHLDELKLIHMNGRVYDPLLARFLSPDSIVQDPSNLQGYNRYSYVLNNPLRYTDPSGHIFETITAAQIFEMLTAYAMTQIGNKHWRMVGSMVLMWHIGRPGGFTEAGLGITDPIAKNVVSAFLSEGLSTGSLDAAALAAGRAGVLGGIGASGMSDPSKVFAHAMLGCVMGAASGGKCGPSAAAAAFGKIATVYGDAGFWMTALAGGTGSVIGGGKFANGAVAAAMGYLFNHGSQSVSQDIPPSRGLQYLRIRLEFDLVEKIETHWVPYLENGEEVRDAHGRQVMTREDWWKSRSGERYLIRDHQLGHNGRFEAGPHLNILRVTDAGQEYAVGRNNGHYFYMPTHPHLHSTFRVGGEARPAVKVLLERQMMMMRANGWQY